MWGWKKLARPEKNTLTLATTGLHSFLHRLLYMADRVRGIRKEIHTTALDFAIVPSVAVIFEVNYSIVCVGDFFP